MAVSRVPAADSSLRGAESVMQGSETSVCGTDSGPSVRGATGVAPDLAALSGSSSSGFSSAAPNLAAALCEMAAWNADSKPVSDSLLLTKAAILEAAGQSDRAYETLGRISRFGLSKSLTAELQRLRIITAWSSGHIDDLRVLLSETDLAALGSAGHGFSSQPAFGDAGHEDFARPAFGDAGHEDFAQPVLGTARYEDFAQPVLGTSDQPSAEIAEPRLRSTDLAMILSIVPGLGSAYAGDWPNAGKYFLINGGVIALGVAAFTTGLPITGILGGGMILSKTLPESTSKATNAVSAWNTRRLQDAYAPLVNSLR